MLDRRRFLKGGAAGLAGILASRRAPAVAQTTRLQLLFRVDFIPQGEAELKLQLAEYGKQMKMEVVLETINENDRQTRITATIQSGSGPYIVHFRYPDGPNGPTPTYHVTYSGAIMKQSNNVAAAKELLKWLHSKEQYARSFELEGGYATGANASWEGSPMWSQVDEATLPFKTAARASRALGYAGPPSAKATFVYTKHIITDMYAKAVPGMTPEDAVRWAETELKRVYEA